MPRTTYYVVWENKRFDVSLSQRKADDFLVCYGLQRKSGLSYEAAASELGACIMHALACEGKLNND